MSTTSQLINRTLVSYPSLRKPTDLEVVQINRLRAGAKTLARFVIDNTSREGPVNRLTHLSLSSLEDSVMWAEKAILAGKD